MRLEIESNFHMVKTKAKLFQTVEVMCDTKVQYTEHFQRLQVPWHLCDKLGERARTGWRLPPEPSAFQVPLHSRGCRAIQYQWLQSQAFQHSATSQQRMAHGPCDDQTKCPLPP